MYSYPPARMGGDAEDYYGEQIADPYRWLETTTDPEIVSWIQAENELTDSYLAAVPARESIREQLTGLWDYPRAGVAFERGGRWFQSRNPWARRAAGALHHGPAGPNGTCAARPPHIVC